jgi:hypothetical protein
MKNLNQFSQIKIFLTLFTIVIGGFLGFNFENPPKIEAQSFGIIRCSAFGGDFVDANKLKALLGTDDITKVDRTKLNSNITRIQELIDTAKINIESAQAKAGLQNYIISTSDTSSLDIANGKCNPDTVSVDITYPVDITYIKACPTQDFFMNKSELVFGPNMVDVNRISWNLDKNIFEQGDKFRIVNLENDGFYFLDGNTQFSNLKNPPNIDSADFLKRIIKPDTNVKITYGKIKLEKDQSQCTNEKKATVYEPEFVTKNKINSQVGNTTTGNTTTGDISTNNNTTTNTYNNSSLPSSDVSGLFEKLRPGGNSTSNPTNNSDSGSNPSGNNNDNSNTNTNNSTSTSIANGNNAGDIKIVDDTNNPNSTIIRDDKTPTKPTKLANGQTQSSQTSTNNPSNPIEVISNPNNLLPVVIIGILILMILVAIGHYIYQKIVKPKLTIFPGNKNIPNLELNKSGFSVGAQGKHPSRPQNKASQRVLGQTMGQESNQTSNQPFGNVKNQYSQQSWNSQNNSQNKIQSNPQTSNQNLRKYPPNLGQNNINNSNLNLAPKMPSYKEFKATHPDNMEKIQPKSRFSFGIPNISSWFKK